MPAAKAIPSTTVANPSLICDIPARSPESIAALLSDPTIATPAATTSGQTLPRGTPADPTTALDMERLVRHWLACQNAGLPLRAWSLFSDGYLYRLLSRQGGITEEEYVALATPAPAVDQHAELLEIRDARVLPDGRFGATVTIAYPSVPMPKTFFFYFTRVYGRLLIDGILGEISFSVP